MIAIGFIGIAAIAGVGGVIIAKTSKKVAENYRTAYTALTAGGLCLMCGMLGELLSIIG